MTNRRYQLELWAWLGLYAILLIASIKLLDGGIISALPARVVVGLSPMIGGFGILALVMRRYRTLDELKQKITAEGLMFGFGSTAILTFGYGFLQRFAGAPDASWFFVWPVLAVTWMIGTALSTARYR